MPRQNMQGHSPRDSDGSVTQILLFSLSRDSWRRSKSFSSNPTNGVGATGALAPGANAGAFGEVGSGTALIERQLAWPPSDTPDSDLAGIE